MSFYKTKTFWFTILAVAAATLAFFWITTPAYAGGMSQPIPNVRPQPRPVVPVPVIINDCKIPVYSTLKPLPGELPKVLYWNIDVDCQPGQVNETHTTWPDQPIKTDPDPTPECRGKCGPDEEPDPVDECEEEDNDDQDPGDDNDGNDDGDDHDNGDDDQDEGDGDDHDNGHGNDDDHDDDSNPGQGGGNHGGGGSGQNNGHGNGDQDAPGNSGGHNNAENSGHSGQGNSGGGKGKGRN